MGNTTNNWLESNWKVLKAFIPPTAGIGRCFQGVCQYLNERYRILCLSSASSDHYSSNVLSESHSFKLQFIKNHRPCGHPKKDWLAVIKASRNCRSVMKQEMKKGFC
jgi:hypothetical protein